VLEIACGTGLVTIPIASQGLDVTGVDLARPMLEHARKKAEAQNLNIRWVEDDPLTLGKISIYLPDWQDFRLPRREIRKLCLPL
jgi:cyclopropane fatty-acyl-phospholipid synthase-like methyltransferase